MAKAISTMGQYLRHNSISYARIFNGKIGEVRLKGRRNYHLTSKLE